MAQDILKSSYHAILKHTHATAIAETTLPPDATSLSTSTLFGFLMLKHCFIMLAAPAIAGLGLIAAGCAVDVRWCIVGLMIWCMALPMICAWCWFRHALNPVTALNLLPHTLQLADNKLTLTVFVKTNNLTDSKETEADDNNDSEQEYKSRLYTFSMTSVLTTEPYSNGQFVLFPDKANAHSGWIFIPSNLEKK